MSAFREALGHQGGKFTAYAIGAALAVGGVIEGLPWVEHEIGGLFGAVGHEIAHVAKGAAHDVGVGLGDAEHALASLASTRSPWRARISIPLQDTAQNFEWPNFTPVVQSPTIVSGTIEASKTSHTFAWDVVYNNVFKPLNHEKATVGISDMVRIIMPKSAVVGAREYILPDPTQKRSIGISFTIDGNALTTERVVPTNAINKEGQRESSSTDGPLVRSENLITDNAGDGARTANLTTLVAEYGQVDTANNMGHDQAFMQANIANAIKADLGSAAYKLALLPKYANAAGSLRQLAALPIKINFVNSAGQPINADQIQYPWPAKMGAHPVAAYAKSIGYNRGEVTFTMAPSTLSKKAEAQRQAVVNAYEAQLNG